jgi:TPR repeat protein
MARHDIDIGRNLNPRSLNQMALTHVVSNIYQALSPGNLYLKGSRTAGIEKDAARAFDLFSQAADQGHTSAGPGRYSSPRHTIHFTLESMVQDVLDDVAGNMMMLRAT